jgi:hypothetical protein
MAHELGHLLLGPGAHSKSGIIQPHWSAMAMQFNLRQAELIRSRLRAAENVRLEPELIQTRSGGTPP